MIIESKDNKNIKYIRKLKNNKFMNEEKKFIVEGDHLVKEAFLSNLLLETYSIDEVDYGVKNTLISNDVMQSISSLNSISKVIGVCRYKDDEKMLGNRIIILDNVQDPGNIGTIIRSAMAFNFDTVVLSKTCPNKYNEKIIRATQGMLFKMNIISCDIVQLINKLKSDNYLVCDTLVDNGKDISTIDIKDKVAIVMGSEGSGVSQEVRDIVDDHIYVSMNDKCESLNVGVCASIVMYEINKKGDK